MSDDAIQRDILVKTTAETDVSALDTAIRKLDELERRIEKLNSGVRVNIGVTGGENLDRLLKQTEGGVSSTGKSVREATNDFKRFGDELRKKEQELGTVATKAKEVERILSNGQRRTTVGFAGDGLTAEFTKETGAQKIAVDVRNTPAAQKAREQQKLDQQALEDQAKFEERVQQARIKNARSAIDDQNKFEERAINARKQLAQQSADDQIRFDDRVVRARIQKAKELISSREDAEKEDFRRTNARASFDVLKARTGAQEVSSPLRANQDGQLVSDKLLVDERGKVIAKLTGDTGRLKTANDDLNKSVKTNGEEFLEAAKKVAIWSAATGLFFGTIRAAKGAVETFSEVEAATVRLERVGRGFTTAAAGSSQAEHDIARGAQEATQEILRLKVEFGATGTEAQDAAVTFARLGLSQKEVVQAVRTSLLAANVAGIGAGEAANLLAAAMSQFGLAARDLPDILNKLNTLENTNRVTTVDMLQAISRSGAVFREAGGSLEQLAAIVATVSQATGRSGAEIGNAFKTIASRLGNADTQAKVFAGTGILIKNKFGDLKDIDQVLAELAVKFINLSEAERAEVGTAVAGVRQRNILQTALDNYFQIQGQVIRQLNSAGSAEKENAQVTGTLAIKFQQLIAAFEQLAVTIVGSGIGDALKAIVDSIKLVVRGLAEMGTLGAVLTGVTVAFFAAAIAARLLGTSMGDIAISLLRIVGVFPAAAVGATVTAAANANLARSYSLTAIAAGQASTAMGVAGAGSVGILGRVAGFLGPIGAILAVVTAIGLTIAAIVGSTASATAQEHFQSQSDVNQGQIKGAQNRVEANRESLRFIDNAKHALEQIEIKEKSGGAASVEANRLRAQIHTELKNILGAEAEEIGSITSAELNAGHLAHAASIIKQKDIKDELELLRVLNEEVNNKARERVAAGVRLRESEDALKRAEKDGARGDVDVPVGADPGFGVGAENSKQGRQKDIANLKREVESARAEVDRLDAELGKAGGARDAFDPAAQSAKKFREELEKTKKEIAEVIDDITKNNEEASRLDENRAVTKSQEIRAKTQRLKNELTDLITSPDAQETLRSDKPSPAKDLLDKRIKKLSNDIDKGEREEDIAKINEENEKRNRILKSRLELESNLGKTIAGALGPDKSKTLREARADLEITERQVQDLQDAIDLLRNPNVSQKSLSDAFNIGPFANKGFISKENFPEDRNGALDEAARLEKEKNKLEDSIPEKNRHLFEEATLGTFKRQTEELKKQNEEIDKQKEKARSELGGLSEIELLRARVLAKNVQDGSISKFGQADFLNLDQKTRQGLLQFQGIFPGRGLVPNIDLGFGDKDFLAPKKAETLENIPGLLKLVDTFRNLNVLDNSQIRGLDKVDFNANNVTIMADGRIQGLGNGLRAGGSAPGNVDFTVSLDGLDVPADRLTNAIALAVQKMAQDMIETNTQRVERAAGPGFVAPVRSRN